MPSVRVCYDPFEPRGAPRPRSEKAGRERAFRPRVGGSASADLQSVLAKAGVVRVAEGACPSPAPWLRAPRASGEAPSGFGANESRDVLSTDNSSLSLTSDGPSPRASVVEDRPVWRGQDACDPLPEEAVWNAADWSSGFLSDRLSDRLSASAPVLSADLAIRSRAQSALAGSGACNWEGYHLDASLCPSLARSWPGRAFSQGSRGSREERPKNLRPREVDQLESASKQVRAVTASLALLPRPLTPDGETHAPAGRQTQAQRGGNAERFTAGAFSHFRSVPVFPQYQRDLRMFMHADRQGALGGHDSDKGAFSDRQHARQSPCPPATRGNTPREEGSGLPQGKAPTGSPLAKAVRRSSVGPDNPGGPAFPVASPSGAARKGFRPYYVPRRAGEGGGALDPADL